MYMYISLMVKRFHINCLNREVIINNLCSLSAWEKNWIMIYDSSNIHSEAVQCTMIVHVEDVWLCTVLHTVDLDYMLYIVCYILPIYIQCFYYISHLFIIFIQVLLIVLMPSEKWMGVIIVWTIMILCTPYTDIVKTGQEWNIF